MRCKFYNNYYCNSEIFNELNAMCEIKYNYHKTPYFFNVIRNAVAIEKELSTHITVNFKLN